MSRPLGPIHLSLNRGDRLILMASNGAGKSTLLRTLAGQQAPLSGQYHVSPATRIGLLAQDYTQPRHSPLSGADWLTLMGSQPPAASPVLKPLLRRRIDQLSGGQWQFLRLASVMGLPVDVILLDEPANHLDAEVWAQSVELIRACPSEKALLLSTHDRQFAEALGFASCSIHQLAQANA